MNNPIYLLKRYLEAKTERNENIIFFTSKDLEKSPQKRPAPKIPDFVEIAGNKPQSLTIITSISPEYTKLNEAATSLLKKILKSVDIDYNNVNIITLKENLLLDPTAEQTEYVKQLAQKFSPKVLCVMGNFTAGIIFGSNDIESFREKKHSIAGISTIATLSPRYIVATEAKTSPAEVKPEKMKVWQDMKIIKKLLG